MKNPSLIVAVIKGVLTIYCKTTINSDLSYVKNLEKQVDKFLTVSGICIKQSLPGSTESITKMAKFLDESLRPS